MRQNEIWKPIPNFPNYLASSLGRFKRLGKHSKEFFLNGKIDRIGYQQIGLIHPDGKQRWFLAHRLIASLFLKPIAEPEGQFLTVNHKDRVKTNNAASNLELVSVQDNHRHWRKFSLFSKGDCQMGGQPK